MIALLLAALGALAPAWGADVDALPVRGALEPGLVTEVDVSVIGDDGRPVTEPPEVASSGTAWTRLGPAGSPGVWRFLAAGPEDVDEVRARVTWPGGSDEVSVPVRAPIGSRLQVTPTSRPARARAVVVTVTGSDLPPTEDLQVVTSEGRITGVRRQEDRIEVTLEPQDRPYARLVVLGVRDARGEALPAWGLVRLVASVDVPIDTTPGSTVDIEVGGRRYGPVRVGQNGRSTLTIEHGPEEASARVRVVDPRGNEAVRSISLSPEVVPRLLSFASGPRYPGEAPPEIVVHAVRADGRAWTREPPSCRAPGLPELSVVRVEAGTFRVQLPAALPTDVWDVRIRCQLGDDVEGSFVVPLAEGVPVGMSFKIWPELLSTDFPVGDVSAFLVNAAGERITAEGTWRAEAGLGFVTLDTASGPTLHGEYEADLAADVGEDEIRLAWSAAPGRGRADRLTIVSGGDDEHPRVDVRVLDPTRRPLSGRSVRLRVGAQDLAATTAADGWAAFPLADVVPGALVRAEALVDGHAARALVRPGVDGGRGKGRPELQRVAQVQIDPGRVADVVLEVTPRVVRPRTSAQIRVRLLDRSGTPATSAAPVLTASAGTLQPEPDEADGTHRWTWIPPAGFARREVRIVARSEEADLSSETTVVVVPAPVEHWIGPSLGVTSNFTTVTSPLTMLDAGWRIKTGPRDLELPAGRPRLFVRAGVGWYGTSFERELFEGHTGALRMDLIPVRLGLELRMEYPAVAWWASLAGEVVPYVGSAAYDGAVKTRRLEVLPPGVVTGLGFGVRVPGGEITFELDGTYLRSPGGNSDVAVPGFLGGLAARVGWRVFY